MSRTECGKPQIFHQCDNMVCIYFRKISQAATNRKDREIKGVGMRAGQEKGPETIRKTLMYMWVIRPGVGVAVEMKRMKS